MYFLIFYNDRLVSSGLKQSNSSQYNINGWFGTDIERSGVFEMHKTERLLIGKGERGQQKSDVVLHWRPCDSVEKRPVNTKQR